jgi:hypothetical protein
MPSWLQSAGVVATLRLGVAVLGNTLLFKPLLEGKLLNLTSGFVFGAGIINAVGICTFGNVVGIAVEPIF